MNSLTFRWLVPVGLVLTMPLVHAQPSPESAGSAGAASKAAPADSALHYRSVFDQYRGFVEQPVVSWREANDTVERIGGWRAYAAEAAKSEAPDPADKSTAAKPGSHAGHGVKP